MTGMFNLPVFKRVIAAAASAGILAGLLLTAVQQVQVTPALLQAEVYEQAAAAALPSRHAERAGGHDHAAGYPVNNGLERVLLSAVSNVFLALGFALLLGAAMLLRGGAIGWRSGLLWGLAGYAVFFVAPSLGLPPEVPGTETALLTDRQTWWLMTVLATAGGLSLLVFARSWAVRMLGVILLGVAHIAGAPQAQFHNSTAPVDLVDSFIYATVLANLVFWLFLGGLLGFFHKKIETSGTGH
jgi:cobalt transporter subunit CbtA